MIEHFPITPEEFYLRRNDRTNRCVSDRRYQSVGCLVTAAPEALETLGEIVPCEPDVPL